MIRLYFTFGTVLLVVLTAVLLWAEPLSPTTAKRQPDGFAIRASENSGSVILSWDPQSPLVRSATGGLLAFEDGGTSHLDKVDARILRRGELEYRRRSGEVLLRLTLLQKQSIIGHASVRLTSAPSPVTAPTPLSLRRDTLKGVPNTSQ